MAPSFEAAEAAVEDGAGAGEVGFRGWRCPAVAVVFPPAAAVGGVDRMREGLPGRELDVAMRSQLTLNPISDSTAPGPSPPPPSDFLAPPRPAPTRHSVVMEMGIKMYT